MNETVAVVVTYNRKKMLKECIDALLKQSCDILVVDNASTDGTYEELKPFLSNEKIIYQNTEKNLGGAGGFNYGMKIGLERGYKYLWIMDDDCIVQKESLHMLLEADRKLQGKYGFLSSVALWKDGSVCTMNIQKDSLKTKIRFPDRITDIPELLEVVMASFVSFFVRAEVIKEVGYPIKEFFIWSDDLEYSRRISMKYKSYVVGKSIVIHKTNNNFGNSIATDDERIERYRYSYRNDYYVFHREGTGGLLYYYFRLLYHFYKILRHSSCNRWKKIKLVLSATREGQKFAPPIEYPEKRL